MKIPTLSLALLALALVTPAQAQFRNRANLDRLNRRLDGRLLDYTHNHGADRRIFSPVLGMPRDLYVYLPPGYTPARAYPLILYFHMANVDEHTISGSNRIVELDRMICRGEIPPVIMASPDGTYSGENRLRAAHSLWVNGCGGRFEDHVMQELVPFLLTHFSIRPEREAHALLGVSAGGFGAMSLALRHRDFFGAVATLAAPLNLRYGNCRKDYFADFDPATYRWKTEYDPDEIVARFYFGLEPVRARRYLEPVFGCAGDIIAAIARVNPADLIFTTDLRPGELAMYVNYGGRDNWNFDAQAESFLWMARQRGIEVTAERVPRGRHNLPYFRANHVRAFCWLGHRLPPPTDRVQGPDGL